VGDASTARPAASPFFFPLLFLIPFLHDAQVEGEQISLELAPLPFFFSSPLSLRRFRAEQRVEKAARQDMAGLGRQPLFSFSSFFSFSFSSSSFFLLFEAIEP